MRGSNNNGGDWRKLILLLALGGAILWWIEVQLVAEYLTVGTRLRESYEHHRRR